MWALALRAAALGWRLASWASIPLALNDAYQSLFGGGTKEKASAQTVSDAISNAATKTGVPLHYLRTLVAIESAGDNLATNGSSRGLCQMQKPAWAQAGVLVALPSYDDSWWVPKFAMLAAAAFTSANVAELRHRGFPEPTDLPSLYIAHQQGVAGLMELAQAAGGVASTSFVTREKMLRNVPPDGLGPTTNRVHFYKRWYAYASSKF